MDPTTQDHTCRTGETKLRTLPARETPLGSAFMQAFCASGLDYPRTIVCTVSIDVRKSLLATGRFLTVFSNSVLRFRTNPELKVLAVEFPLAPFPVGIVTLKNRTLSPTARLFISTPARLRSRS